MLNQLEKQLFSIVIPSYMKRIAENKIMIYEQTYKNKFLASILPIEENEYRQEAFKKYCEYEIIDYKKIIDKIMFQEKINKIFHIKKLISIFERIKKKMKSIFVKHYSINLKQNSYMKYKDLNIFISNNEVIKSIIESIDDWV